VIRTSRHGVAKSDQDITTLHTTTPSIELQGPITRSRAQQLNHQVNSLLCLSANDYENRLLRNKVIVIRNQGVDHGEHVGHQDGAGEPRKHAQHDVGPIKFRVQESAFESNSRSPRVLSSPTHGVQDHLAFKLKYRACLTSDLGDLHMHGKITR
jgi:hypothetical protein